MTAIEPSRRRNADAATAAATGTLSERAIRRLAAGFDGLLIQPGDNRYDTARRVWNGSIDRYPAVVARCASPRDVSRVVALAGDLGVPLAVRGGGHNVAGFGTCDGGIVADLSLLATVRVDAAARTATVGGGATWGMFDHATHVDSLATTGGQVSTTGVGGLTLGGGIGWLMRRYGLSCDNVVSAQIVTADGRQVVARDGEHDDLFWALRGGGGNFGAVTEFTFALHPVSHVLAGVVLQPVQRAAEVLGFFRDYVATAPDEVAPFVGVWTPVPTAPLPPSLAGRPVVAMGACYAGDPVAGERVLAPLRMFGNPEFDDFALLPYPRLQRMLDEGAPAGLQNDARSEYLRELTDQAIGELVAAAGALPGPASQLYVVALGGAISRVPEGATAFSHRTAPFVVNILSIWHDDRDSERQVGWARRLWSALQPASAGGAYVNFLATEGPDRVRAAYGESTFARLASVKARYDPSNTFRLNQNIPPASASRR